MKDLRVLIHAPRGRDAAVVQTVLEHQGIAAHVCHGKQELLEALREGASNGSEAGSKLGGPMSTDTRPSANTDACSSPPAVSIVRALPPGLRRRCRNAAAQRAPLPDCSASTPSALKMR